MSYLFVDKQFFLFLCLRTSKILSLKEFDELKSHLFLVHFSVCFSSKKRIINMQKYEETHQFVVSRKRKRKKKKRWKNAAISGVKVQSDGKAEMKATG